MHFHIYFFSCFQGQDCLIVMICTVTSSQSSASHWRYIWFWIQSLSNGSGGAELFSNDVCCLFNEGINDTTNLSRFWNSLVYTGIEIIISQQHWSSNLSIKGVHSCSQTPFCLWGLKEKQESWLWHWIHIALFITQELQFSFLLCYWLASLGYFLASYTLKSICSPQIFL